MPRFFIHPADLSVGSVHVIKGEDADHIVKSLRMSIGEELTLCDCSGLDYSADIISLTKDSVEAVITDISKTVSEAVIKVTLYQSLPKGDKFELIVQKSTELGAVAVVPVITERTLSRPKENFTKKQQRLQRIALEAAKQSGRGILPQVGMPVTFDEAIALMKTDDIAIMFYEKADKLLSKVIGDCTEKITGVSILVGPEGGFSSCEVEKAKNQEVKIAGLGARILRCETAPIAAIAAIMYNFGEF